MANRPSRAGRRQPQEAAPQPIGRAAAVSPAGAIAGGSASAQAAPAAAREAQPPSLEPPAEMARPGVPPSPLPPPVDWASPAEAAARKWLLWGAASVAGLVVLVGAWSLLSSGKTPRDLAAPAGPPAAAPVEPPAPAPPAGPAFDARWIPDAPELLLRLEVATLEASGVLETIYQAAPGVREAVAESLFKGFGLQPKAVRRVTWASADLGDWTGQGVAVIELAEGQNAGVLRSAGEPLDWRLEGRPARRLNRPAWTLPYVVLDDRTIVTGEASLLGQLAGRGGDSADLGGLSPFFAAAPADADLLLGIDLSAARTAGWPLPTEWLDVWPEGKASWNLIWGMPVGLGVVYEGGDLSLMELALICEGHTAADKIRTALGQFSPQARSVLASRIDRMAASIAAGEIEAAEASRYELALRGSLAALESAEVDLVDRCVWVRTDLGGNSAEWTSAVAASEAAARSDWLRAAGAVDEEAHGRLHGALARHDGDEGRMPAGVLNPGLLPPETRLSWITAMLPYLGHAAWSEQLDASYSWDGPKNRPVTTKRLGEVLNPALRPRQTDAGYPVSHYAGVAGIGADAAMLPRDDPRAGVFGFQASRRLGEIPDGASNTIATAGVAAELGPWAAGGTATVRALTQQPYINGPDGFGSGQPGGMYVGMADGSARFLSKDIAPEVVEQLATAAGGEVLKLAGEGPKPPPVPEPPNAETPGGPEGLPKVDKAETESHGGQEATPPIDNPEASAVAEQPEGAPDAQPPAAPAADAAVQLAAVISGVAITDVPLKDAVEVFSRYGGFKTTFDLAAMSELGVRFDRPVALRQTGTTVATALNVMLGSCGLAAVPVGGHVLITSPASRSAVFGSVRYTVDDLAEPGGAGVSELGSLITRLVAPESWQAAGGPGTFRADGSVLEIGQTEAVHRQILVFCERLRVARRLPTRSSRPAEQFALTPRLIRAAPLLARPVSVNFFEPVPVERIVEELARITESQIAVEWLALEEQGKSPAVAAAITLQDAPLGEGLATLLGPLELAYRVIDAETIEITTPARLASQLEREFHPIGELLENGQTAAALIQRIREEIGAAWADSGGPGQIVFDEPSRCLIVLHSQSVQAAIGRLLGEQ
ncbi:MAG: DUF1559 domain-containing protein [Planctomycetota bacterium]|nr:DUF1559 domain-containing protein [Planctomycetota bacterium]